MIKLFYKINFSIINLFVFIVGIGISMLLDRDLTWAGTALSHLGNFQPMRTYFVATLLILGITLNFFTYKILVSKFNFKIFFTNSLYLNSSLISMILLPIGAFTTALVTWYQNAFLHNLGSHIFISALIAIPLYASMSGGFIKDKFTICSTIIFGICLLLALLFEKLPFPLIYSQITIFFLLFAWSIYTENKINKEKNLED